MSLLIICPSEAVEVPTTTARLLSRMKAIKRYHTMPIFQAKNRTTTVVRFLSLANECQCNTLFISSARSADAVHIGVIR